MLLTTSFFTEEAQKAAKKNPQYKVVLIDGKRLTSLMLEYNLGVGIQNSYIVKRIEQDYFEEI